MNERLIGPFFVVATLSAFGLMATYVTGADFGFADLSAHEAQVQGAFLLGAFGGIGLAMILWGKHLMPNDEVEQERQKFADPEQQEKAVNRIEHGLESVTRRKFLTRLGIGAVGSLGLAALFPLKSLGPNPGKSLFETKWRRGMRLVTLEGGFVRPDTLAIGSILTVFPKKEDFEERRHDQSATLLVRVPEALIQHRKGRETWAPAGNLAYSKICTHVGCPVSLYRDVTHELLCPCHQSTFDVLDGGRAVFGPATRSLPQLPLGVDDEGYLIAMSDYQEPVGPGFWNRGRKQKETDGVA